MTINLTRRHISQISGPRHLDLDLGSGEKFYRHASLIDLHILLPTPYLVTQNTSMVRTTDKITNLTALATHAAK